MFRADELLVALTRADIRFVIIGGIAVGVHGYVRATKDFDIVPDPDRGNLVLLAHLLADIDAEHVGLGDFSPDEFPFDPLDPDQLGQGANCRLNTSLGPLDVMQWIAGIDADDGSWLVHQTSGFGLTPSQRGWVGRRGCVSTAARNMRVALTRRLMSTSVPSRPCSSAAEPAEPRRRPLPKRRDPAFDDSYSSSCAVAALIHDPALDPNPEVVEALTATSLMLLENARLVQELRESRTRIVRAGERERRRLEHDLHDGAQAQLVAIQIRLELARELTDPAQIAEQIVATQHDLETALEELRDLAHGIYPAALRDLGPAGALHSLALNSSVPVEVIDDWMGRSSDATEAAIYFCAREAIQNTAKHAGPGAKTVVRLKHDERGIELTVSDDGAGLARDVYTDGMGITGMQDRIESVGGRFEIVSAPGRGTSVCATIPDGAA